MKPRFIVAELAKNWHAEYVVEPSEFLSQYFERVININRDRGYRLMSWQLHRMMVAPLELNETIIAVFERVECEPVTSGRTSWEPEW